MICRSSRFRILAAALCVLAGWSALAAQESHTVTAFVDPAGKQTDARPFRFVIQVEGPGSPQVVPPRMEGLTNLTVLSGPSTNSSFVWRNGRSSATFQLIYTVLAERPGAAQIPSLEFQVDSKPYRTKALSLVVAPGPAAGTPTPEKTQRRGNTRSSDQELDVFLVAELGTTDAWVGQIVPLNVTLYTLQSVSEPRWRELPDFANFWVENIDVEPETEKFRKRIDGRLYTAYPIDRRLVVPPSPGEYELEPYVAQMQVSLGRNDPFDIFSRRRSQTVIRKTKPLNLRVRPLPGGKPDNYSGAVGVYNMSVELDQTDVAVNDAVALKVTVRGKGSLRAVGAPHFAPPADLKVFDPDVKESFKATRDGMTSTKSWEWILVPLAPGELQLPEVRFTYFNPVSEQYELARGESLTLAVGRGDSTPDPRMARGDVQLQRKDLAFIKPLRGPLTEGRTRAHESRLFVALGFLPAGLVPLFIVIGRRRDRLQRDHGLARGRRARTRARKRFQAVRKRLDEIESGTFHEEVARTLVEYVADRFNRSAAGLTYDLADELLGSQGIETDLRRRFRSCLESCDFARFVPASGESRRRTEILEEAADIVQQLERAW